MHRGCSPAARTGGARQRRAGARVGERLRRRRVAVEGWGRAWRSRGCYACAESGGGSPAATNHGGGREEKEAVAGRAC
jgi:hypothetical protein